MAQAQCSFCGELGSPGRRLLSGPDGTTICRDCAELAAKVLAEPNTPEPDLLLRNLTAVVTMDPRFSGPASVDDRRGLLGIVSGAAVAIRRGRIVWLGALGELPQPYRDLPDIDCGGRIAVPGFVDGSAPLLGAASASRPDPHALADAATAAVRAMGERGVCSVTLEVGGSVEPTADTLRLAVARSVSDRVIGQVNVAWRCHPDLAGPMLDDVMAPTVSRLAELVLLTCTGDPKIVGQAAAFRTTRFSLACCETEPTACAELMHEAVSIRGAPAGVAGTAGPTPIVGWWEAGKARNHWSLGERPALTTGSDPGERVLTGMGLVLMSAVDLAGLGLPEALWSITRGGAIAGGDGERGWIHLGGPADIVIIDGDDLRDLTRTPDGNTAWTVIANGVELGR